MKKKVKITLGVVGIVGLGALTYFVIVPKIQKIMSVRKCNKLKGKVEGDFCVMGSKKTRL